MLFGWIAMFSESLEVSIVTFVLFYFLTHSYTPPVYAVLMAKTPVRMRGTVMSLLQLVTNLIGFGIGAAWVGLVSDCLGGGEASWGPSHGTARRVLRPSRSPPKSSRSANALRATR